MKTINEIEARKNWQHVKHLISWDDYKFILLKSGYVIISFDTEGRIKKLTPSLY